MKKLMKAILPLALLLTGVAASGTALAGGPHISFGIVVAPPLVYRADPYPYYHHHHRYYRQQVIVQSPPPVYVEQSAYPPAPIQQAQNNWYYCAAAGAYYPYVKQCPGGWQQVTPSAY